jgi:hypothetical protein
LRICPFCVKADAADDYACGDCERDIVAPAQLRGETIWRYGRFEMCPAIYDVDAGRAFVLFVAADGFWREMPYGEVFNKVGMRPRAELDSYTDLPPLPA